MAAALQPGPALRPISPDFVESVLLVRCWALGGTDCLLTVTDVARVLRVSKATVYKLVAEGKLPHVRVRNAIRFVRPEFAPDAQ